MFTTCFRVKTPQSQGGPETLSGARHLNLCLPSSHPPIFFLSKTPQFSHLNLLFRYITKYLPSNHNFIIKLRLLLVFISNDII